MKYLCIAFTLMISTSVFSQIQQNVNKTTGTESNAINDIDSIRFNAGQTEMEIILNNGNIESHTISDINNVTFSGQLVGEVTSLDCAAATITGTLVEGVAASGVSAEISYTGGNGGPHNGQTVASTGVTGLTATLTAGNFATGAGTLTYTITGTPNTSGTASFAIQIGGISCTLEITVGCNGVSTAVVEVTGANGTIWMDRNLGACQAATSSTDVDAYGDLYQWGRGADGHQFRTAPTTATLSSVDQPGNGNFIITGLNVPYDWRSPQNTNLWQGVNGVNNPCPTGFRIPTEAELDAERASWSSQDAAGAFASPLKLTLAGGRSEDIGLFAGVGTTGFYWSSTVNSPNSRNLNFNSGAVLINSNVRAYGHSVRCIKD